MGRTEKLQLEQPSVVCPVHSSGSDCSVQGKCLSSAFKVLYIWFSVLNNIWWPRRPHCPVLGSCWVVLF